MKFKIGLVAGAMSLATLFATGASAASLNAAALTYSQQGLASAATGTAVVLPAFTANLASEFLPNDLIVVTVTGVPLAAGLNPTLTCTSNPSSVPPGGHENAAAAALTIGFLSQSGNTLTFRVTSRTGANGTVSTGLVCTSSAINTTTDKLAAVSSVTATWAATAALSNTPIDLLCATGDTGAAGGAPFTLGAAAACVSPAVANVVTLATVANQFGETVTQALNGIVDVNFAYEQFASPSGAGNTITTNNLGLTLTNNTAYTDAVTVTSVAANLTGNFSEIPGTAGSCSASVLTNYTTPGTYLTTPTVTGAGSCANLTLTWSHATPGLLAGQVATVGIVEPAPSGTDLPLVAPQTFTGTVGWTYTGSLAPNTAGLIQADTITPGAWTLNGFQARVGYMPYASNITRVVYLSNKSSLAGNATMVARNIAGVACPATGSAVLGAIPAHAVTSLSAAVDAAVLACYGPGAVTDKIDMTITATIPQTSGYLFSAYTVDGTSRQIIVNSSDVQP
jgi:hypothetical protein